ncbi:hypothetical protein [Streptosporangium sp. NPDC048865]|uniref:hypothetical protein n=1 Tax=Streptosporangium sp. NPDC048865 TaxID=3155766 RepID=UPI003447F4CC
MTDGRRQPCSRRRRRPHRPAEQVLAEAGLPPHVEEHLTAILVRPHRENRYDDASGDVERVTGVPTRPIEAFVAARRDLHPG